MTKKHNSLRGRGQFKSIQEGKFAKPILGIELSIVRKPIYEVPKYDTFRV